MVDSIKLHSLTENVKLDGTTWRTKWGLARTTGFKSDVVVGEIANQRGFASMIEFNQMNILFLKQELGKAGFKLATLVWFCFGSVFNKWFIRLKKKYDLHSN